MLPRGGCRTSGARGGCARDTLSEPLRTDVTHRSTDCLGDPHHTRIDLAARLPPSSALPPSSPPPSSSLHCHRITTNPPSTPPPRTTHCHPDHHRGTLNRGTMRSCDPRQHSLLPMPRSSEGSLRGKKYSRNGRSAKRSRVAHMFNHGWWRLVVGGWWRLAVDGWWRLAVGGWWRLAVDGWWRLAVGG